MKYRREIDGLRAVAVLPVLFFHAGFAAFGGGFVGVDIFFVISGYLITSILLDEHSRGSFSLASFYERRARRIMPALIFVLSASSIAAWLLLTPADMRLFGKSLAAMMAFGSNFSFWRESGYFDTSAELKPLLHTWSLSVEEQYYVLFPLLLALLWRFRIRVVAIVICAALLASLAAAQYLTTRMPSAAFFLLPTRAWELALGSLLAVHAFSRQDPPKLAGSLALIGLAMITGSVFLIQPSAPFPGLLALVPTVGACLVIYTAHSDNAVGRLLASKPLVWMGLISYSTYLWHQPLFAFARHFLVLEVNTAMYLGLIAASVGMGWASWRWVEAPFRDRRRTSRRAVWGVAATGSIALAIFGVAGFASGGFPARLSPQEATFLDHFDNSLPAWKYFTAQNIPRLFRDDCNFYDIAAYRAGRANRQPLPNISQDCYSRRTESARALFLWGDSHVQHFRPGLARHSPPDWQLLQVTSSGCTPSIAPVDPADYCGYSNQFALDAITRTKPEVVLISQNTERDPKVMLAMASELRRRGVMHVIFAGPSPHWKISLPVLVATKLGLPNPPRRTRVGVEARNVLEDAVSRAAVKGDGIHYVSPIEYFCNQAGCTTFIGPDPIAGITSWDYGHLTPVASEAFARDVLSPLLRSFEPGAQNARRL